MNKEKLIYDEENKKINLEFDIVPVTEGVIAFDTLHGYDNIHMNYVVEYGDFKNNREKILNSVVDSVLHSYEVNEKIKSECRNS